LLTQAKAIASEQASTSSLWVRLLATPARIRAELGESDAAARGLLRELWRGAGKRFYDGIPVSPDMLPPGFGGAGGVRMLLDDLQDRQFVVWHGTGGGIRLRSPPPRSHAFASTGKSSTAGAAPSCPSSTRCRCTPTRRGAGAHSCSATSAIRRRAR